MKVRVVTWSFDGTYRLTGETVANDPAKVNGSVGYTLDPAGNRLTESSSLQGINSGTFSYNPDDELTGEMYDGDGNVTETGGKSFTYDSQNELISMNGGAVTIQYDGDGNRVTETASGTTTRYLVDNLNPTGYAQVVEETVNGAPQREYTYGLQRIDEDQIVNNAWTASYYDYDGFGTVRQLTNLSGAVTDSYEYDAFGNLLNHTGSTPNNYLYRGEQWNPNLNLYYLRARYYNPLTGRFMSRDPNAGLMAIPVTLHKYLYAGGDPVDGNDPSGRDDLEYVELAVHVYHGIVEPALGQYHLGQCIATAYLAEAQAFNPAMVSEISGSQIAHELAACVYEEDKKFLGAAGNTLP